MTDTSLKLTRKPGHGKRVLLSALKYALLIFFATIALIPFVWMLSGSTHAIMKFLGFSHIIEDNVTHEDIQAMLQEGSSAGIIEHSEHAMVKNVFRLDERSISSLMVKE